MKILILNWRDIKNPQSGGAETLTQAMAKRWVKWGHEVTQISSRFPRCQKREIIDGVQIIRFGQWWNVHVLASLYYLKNLRKEIDVVIDEVHWLPFFSALYARKKTVLLACEVANNLFFQVFPYPLALIGRLLEKIYLSFYKNIPALTISPSTKKDLLDEGFKKEKITIIPMGLTLPKILKIYPKEKRPTLIYLGRINKQKGIEEAIEVFNLIKQKIPDCQFWVVGSGKEKYVQKIKKKATDLGLSSVKFFGFVPEKEKFKLLSKAHLLLVPSFHEGWGLIVPEAGRVGTPVVAYQVAGLKDVIQNGVNGFLVEPKPEALAMKTVNILQTPQKWATLRRGAMQEAQKYNWETTAKKALLILKKKNNKN